MPDKHSFFKGPRPDTDKFPNAVRKGDLVFTSGFVAIDDDFAVIAPGDVVAQSDLVFSRLAALLEHAGSSMEDVLKISAYLVADADYPLYNEARHRWFPNDPPASSTVVVASLVKPGLVVEIEAIAWARSADSD
jgi:enamine deaminase RidA (YjgF/YER057c/UK114 family)